MQFICCSNTLYFLGGKRNGPKVNLPGQLHSVFGQSVRKGINISSLSEFEAYLIFDVNFSDLGFGVSAVGDMQKSHQFKEHKSL